jgi:phospholipid/cholesterol/gamma-HCH transport system substrate-binding protein
VKRLTVITAVLAAATVAVLGTGAGDEGGYKVRAIFDNAVSVIPGEDVKIAGVKVGTVESLDVTADKKAAIVLRITEPGFRDFRSDATCIIRPQSLIGEKFVECTPTQPKPVGSPQAPPLRRIESGPGKGQHLLPVSQTSTPVDIDLINNVLRRPYAERLSIILNELGIAVAGRGQDINATIRRANPALRETDKVLAILARQNRVLADLASDSDAILEPLARERRAMADSFVQQNTVAEATAERGDDLERNLALLPPFLRQLRPTMRRLGALADQATPVLVDLGARAPSINTLIRQLGPFSRAALPALRTLGQAGDIGGPALVRSRPTIRELRRFARSGRPVARNLALLLNSFQRTGGVERLMDYIFYQVAAINGFDQFGHYLRAGLIVNSCSTYAVEPIEGCSANFQRTTGTSSELSAGQRRNLAARLAALADDQPAPAATKPTGGGGGPVPAPPVAPRIVLPGGLEELLQGGRSQPRPAAPRPPKAGVPAPDPREGLLDYLLGSER